MKYVDGMGREYVTDPGLGMITLSFAKHLERERLLRCPSCGRRKRPEDNMCKRCNPFSERGSNE